MTNVIFAGVGGQGVILAGRILMDVVMRSGFDVKSSEVHGMAQRGGSVDCHVRFADKVHSPLIPKGKADYIVALEQLEAVRKIEYLVPGGTIIVNDLQIDPAPVQTGQMEYPQDLAEWIAKHVPCNYIVDTKAALKELGSVKVLNVVMLGILSKLLDFDVKLWEQSIRSGVREKFVDLNLRAFEHGQELISKNVND